MEPSGNKPVIGGEGAAKGNSKSLEEGERGKKFLREEFGCSVDGINTDSVIWSVSSLFTHKNQSIRCDV